ncbi:peptidoglycan-binding domain-containing protein [Marinobacter halotolerans]|uniref:peptidoglycan-binding domain-containing protein n=1 Tax=Marinobacter halotolerans TaxID=1569211 RepID=UPI001248FB78|nr:peptidoglycan-binding domain-containing protein [Marinobacter halotolerans]
MNSFSHLRGYLTAAIVAGSLVLAPAAMADETVALKNALYGAGYSITNVTPQMDEATRQALIKFQKDNGLAASGVVNEATKEALGMVPVQVAAASQASSPAGTSQAAKSEPASAPESEKATEETEEEEDDGGWSFF